MKQHKKTKQKLKAFLLAAGRGERLRPLTDTTPKCLLPIDGTPLLQIWLEHLERSGFDEVLINTHWLHEKVEKFVEVWLSRHKTIKIDLFHEPSLLGSAGTLLAKREWAGSGPFFIIYGDNLTRFNLRKMLSFHKKKASRLPSGYTRGLIQNVPELSVLMPMALSSILRKNRRTPNQIWEPAVSMLPMQEFMIISRILLNRRARMGFLT